MSLLSLISDRVQKSGALEPLIKKLESGKKGGRARVVLTGPRGSDLSFVVGEVHKHRLAESKGRAATLLISHKLEPSEQHYDDLLFFGLPSVHHYPAWETLPFEEDTVQLEIGAKRLDTLAHLAGVARGPEDADLPAPAVSVPATSLLQKTVPAEWLREISQVVRWGEQLDVTALTDRLVRLGYIQTPMVEGRGEFSVRGGIIDVFSLHEEHPVRLDLFGDEVESIRAFDLATQRSLTKETIEYVLFLPADEQQMLAQARREGQKLVPLFDYLDPASLIAEDTPELYRDEVRKFWELIEMELRLFRDGKKVWLDPAKYPGGKAPEDAAAQNGKGSSDTREIPDPADFYLTIDELEEYLHRYTLLASTRLGVDDAELRARAEEAKMHLRDAELKARGFSDVKPELDTWLGTVQARQHEDYLVVVVCDNEGQAMRFDGIMREREMASLRIDDPHHEEGRLKLRGPLEGYPEAVITIGELAHGFVFPEAHLLFITDREVFGRYKRRHVYKKVYKGQAIKSADEIRRGDLVVHIEHGIGRFNGIRRQEIDGEPRDLIEIEYKDTDKLLVPVDNVRYVQKYATSTGAEPSLDKLGGARWEKRKNKSSEEVEKMAAELLQLYAQREAARGAAYEPDGPMQREFEAGFLYQETPDQLSAISAVKEEMESEQPMDRLVCGDVGFGKTEIAIRSAFKAIQDGRQVALLCPTTILAQQHYLTFTERYADYPVRVEQMSRFQTAKEHKAVLADLKTGKVDMVIGTHRLLSQDVKFADLGLLVIDEEQRFGVKHKERLKQLRTEVDTLTLTATPIPRTLYMALSGLRDMSLISTPPADRYPVRTRVISFRKESIEEALRREFNRGGQVFFVHNRVHNIQQIKERLQEIVPEAKIAIAHGQMKERELEEIMLDFIDQKYDILLATTIIENGLDIPNVNTIIINRADAFGLAQLYQLRGRVGRSRRRAYAYLIVPDGQPITEAAVRRLEAIQEFTELGSGFNVAMRDMEIRGTGNILGAEQHGTMEAIGFELYCELLETAVQRMRGEVGRERSTDVEVVWRVAAFIPPEFIPVEAQRFTFYKRVAAARSLEEIETLNEELRDRFGKLPEAVENILKIARLRILTGQMGAIRLAMTPDGFKLRIAKGNDDGTAMPLWMKLVRTHPGVDAADRAPDNDITVKVKGWSKGRRLEKADKILRAFLMAEEARDEAKNKEPAGAAR